MAKCNHTRNTNSTATQSQIRTITAVPYFSYRKLGSSFSISNQSPKSMVALKGKWLHDVGFTEGTKIKLYVMQDCIVMVKADPKDKDSAELGTKELKKSRNRQRIKNDINQS